MSMDALMSVDDFSTSDGKFVSFRPVGLTLEFMKLNCVYQASISTWVR